MNDAADAAETLEALILKGLSPREIVALIAQACEDCSTNETDRWADDAAELRRFHRWGRLSK